MAIGLWLLFDQQLYLQSIGAAEQTDYIVGTYVVLGVGMVMTLVGFLGCCGSWKESPWMLATFFVFLIIILVGEVAIGVLVYTRYAHYHVLSSLTSKLDSDHTCSLLHQDRVVRRVHPELCGDDGGQEIPQQLHRRHPELRPPAREGTNYNHIFTLLFF